MNNAAVVSMLRHGKLPAIGAWAIVTEYLPCLGLLRDLQPDGDGQKAMLRLLQRCVQRFCELLEVCGRGQLCDGAAVNEAHCVIVVPLRVRLCSAPGC